jgi:chromosome segregation ATPase
MTKSIAERDSKIESLQVSLTSMQARLEQAKHEATSKQNEREQMEKDLTQVERTLVWFLLFKFLL